MNRTLRLATFAVPLSGNKGSASMLLGLRDAFSAARMDVQFEVFSYYPERDRELAKDFGNLSVHAGHPKDIAFRLMPALMLPRFMQSWLPSRLRSAVQALHACDAVLLVGGTTFADSMLYKTPWNVLAALPGYRLRKVTVFLSQTLGPFEKWLNRQAARWTLRRAAAVHGRGRVSADWARTLGITACDYRPDLSFSLRVPDFAELAERTEILGRFRQTLQNTQRKAIGIAPNTIVYEKTKQIGVDYLSCIVTCVEAVHRLGYLPTLIAHSYREDSASLHNNDRTLCRVIMYRLPAGVECFFVDADLTAVELRSLIGQFDVLIASRFHAMVSALAVGTVPITYGWGDHKYLEVLSEFGAEELYTSYRELAPSKMANRLESVLRDRERLSSLLKENLVQVRNQADSLPYEILSLIEERT